MSFEMFVKDLLSNNSSSIAYLVETKLVDLNQKHAKDLSPNPYCKFVIKGVEGRQENYIGYNSLIYYEISVIRMDYILSLSKKQEGQYGTIDYCCLWPKRPA